MRCPRSTPTNTLLWFSHVTKRTTCPTLLFQSVKGSDPFRRGTSYSLAAPRYDALCQHLATKRYLIKTVPSQHSPHTLSLKNRAHSPRKMKRDHRGSPRSATNKVSLGLSRHSHSPFELWAPEYGTNRAGLGKCCGASVARSDHILRVWGVTGMQTGSGVELGRG
jgi:hypothetical protein